MGLDDLFEQRQVPIENFEAEGRELPNQQGELRWEYGENFSNFKELSLVELDTAIFNEFQNKAVIYVDGTAVPVVMGGSEKWYIASKTYLRDEDTNALRLPIMSIKLGDTQLDRGRWVPKTRFGATDLEIRTIIKDDGHTRTERIVTVSPPIPVQNRYEIVIWTAHIEDLKIIQTQLLHHFSNNAVYYNEFFFSTVMEENIGVQDNFEEYGAEERLIRGTMNLTLHAYLLDPIKSYNIQNKVLNVKTDLRVTEKIIKPEDEEYHWRSPYELRWRKV